MREVFTERPCCAVVAFEEVPMDEVHRYGIADPGEDGEVFELRDVVEKPTAGEAPSRLAIAARYLFSPSIFKALRQTRPGKDGEIQLTDAIRLLIQDGERVLGIRLPPGERRYDIGSFDSYFKAFLEFILSDPEYGVEMKNHARRLLDALD
jgi:UTP--glucose-1-phosphate uridylyltransferase